MSPTRGWASLVVASGRAGTVGHARGVGGHRHAVEAGTTQTGTGGQGGHASARQAGSMSSPHETMRSGWMRIIGPGSRTISARPRTSMPRGRPGVDAPQVIDDDGRPAASLHIAVLLRLLELAPADIDRVLLTVVAPTDRGDVWRPV